MSSQDLTPTSYVVLALVGRDGAGPHDIATMLERSPLYWSAARSRYYAEPRRLKELGYLDASEIEGKTRPKTLYELTDKGLSALQRWLRRPARFPEIRNEAAIRLLAGDLISDREIITSLRGLEQRIDELARSLDEAELVAESIPHRERYLRLSHRLPRKILAAHREWIAEVTTELDQRAE